MLLSCIFSGCGTNALSQTQPSSSVEKSTLEDISSLNIVEADFPEAYMVEQDNYFDYQPGPECSAFSSAYLLRHYGEEAVGLELYQDFPGKLPDGNGVYPQGIVSFFLDKGYEAEFVSDATVEDLKREIAKGAPVIVFIHGQEPVDNLHNTHYVPIIGYDEAYFYFAESSSGLANCKDEEDVAYNRKTEIETFEKLWVNIDGVWDHPYFSILPPSKE